MKKVVILLGNAGSGKSLVAGKLLNLGYRKLAIDDFYPLVSPKKFDLKLWKNQPLIKKAYRMMFRKVCQFLNKGEKIVLDSTGVSIEWRWFMKKLVAMKDLDFVRIYLKVPIKILKERVRKRNKSGKQIIDVSFVDFIAKRMKVVGLKYDYVVDGKLSSDLVFSEVLKIIK